MASAAGLPLLMLMAAIAAGCARPAPPDAYGNVEATAVVVGAETGGRIVSFQPKEGDSLAADAVVGTIDAVELGLQRDQLEAQRGANTSRVNEVTQQVDVLQAQRNVAVAQRDAARAQSAALEAQREIARRTYERTQRLYAQQAATAQQLDQAERDARVLDEQIKAHDSQIQAQMQQIEAARAQRQTATAQVTSSTAQVAQVAERMRKSQISNPIGGTVLTTYAKTGEFVQPGQPLYKIANLASVEVRAYVTEPQLAQVKLGATARITIDAGSGTHRSLTGTISWISSEAEFTPTPIQTREERADLVYAVKIRVPNEGGVLKIGMPADVQFDTAGTAK